MNLLFPFCADSEKAAMTLSKRFGSIWLKRVISSFAVRLRATIERREEGRGWRQTSGRLHIGKKFRIDHDIGTPVVTPGCVGEHKDEYSQRVIIFFPRFGATDSGTSLGEKGRAMPESACAGWLPGGWFNRQTT